MKTNNLVIFLAIAALFMPAGVFAAETNVEEATDKTLAALEPEKSNAAEEMQKADKDSFKEEDFFVDETETPPVAAVAGVEKKTNAIPVSQNKTVSAEADVPQTSSTLNPAELQRRWKALFSKEITSGSKAYTVKSGDSLYVLARKNHTTVDLIKKINGLTSDDIYPGMKFKIHTAPFSIKIDKSKNVLVLYSSGEAVKEYSVATGKKNCTPVGEFKIKDKLVNPTWFKTGAILPPGSPENALGTRWMGFDKPAYGIHGTIEPKSIGTQASEGCIRMLNEDVEELYSIVPVGTKVTIQD